jgi:hypothetical protein
VSEQVVSEGPGAIVQLCPRHGGDERGSSVILAGGPADGTGVDSSLDQPAGRGVRDLEVFGDIADGGRRFLVERVEHEERGQLDGSVLVGDRPRRLQEAAQGQQRTIQLVQDFVINPAHTCTIHA